MNISKQELQNTCIQALQAAGASNQHCEFYSEAIQCEYNMTHATYRLQKELKDPDAQKDIAILLALIQKLCKNFNSWKRTLEGLELRQNSLPPLQIDPRKLSPTQKALCSLQTKELKVTEGEALTVIDTSQADRLKIRNIRGEEAFVPTLCCLLPLPDNTALNTIERLEIHLLTWWTDCERKLKEVLKVSLAISALNLSAKWSTGVDNRTISNWEERVNRRMKRIQDVVSQDDIDMNRLHKTLTSLENELLWRRSEAFTPIIQSVATLDKTVLCYQAFRKQCRQLRRHLAESSRPINIQLSWDPQLFKNDAKNLRYYEVKLTSMETVTKEETLYVPPSSSSTTTSTLTTTSTTKRPSSSSSDQGDGVQTAGGKRKESVEAEQLTSISHEENRRFVIKSVLDQSSGKDVSMKEAVIAGIIDHGAGTYNNLVTGESCPILAAMNDGLIKIEYVSTTKTQEKTESIGLITIRTQTDNREYIIVGAVDALTGGRLGADEARDKGIINEMDGYYVDARSGSRIPLDDAIESGWVLTQFDPEDTREPVCETKTYAVNAVVDQILRRAVPFAEAVQRRLVDRETGDYVNNRTWERVYAAEAIRRGFFKCVQVDDPNSLNIDATNHLVVDRIQKVRKNILRSIRVVNALTSHTTDK